MSHFKRVEDPLADQYPQHKGATENDLRREFEMYGTIERVRIVKDKKGRGRGYAFIVYERERDMKGYWNLAFYFSLWNAR